MLERLTEKAVKAVMLAEEESRRLGQNVVCPEQLLLGLIGEGSGIAAKVLKSMSITLLKARTEVETIIGRGSRRSNEWDLPFSTEAQRVLELASEESSALGHDFIGTEHLLLGLLQVEESVAIRALENLGIELNRIRDRVLQMTNISKRPTSRERFSLQPSRNSLREILPGTSSRALKVWHALGSQVGWENTNVEMDIIQIIQITHLNEQAIRAALMELVVLKIITRD